MSQDPFHTYSCQLHGLFASTEPCPKCKEGGDLEPLPAVGEPSALTEPAQASELAALGLAFPLVASSSAYYDQIEDAEGRLVTFMAMHEYSPKITRAFVEILNRHDELAKAAASAPAPQAALAAPPKEGSELDLEAKIMRMVHHARLMNDFEDDEQKYRQLKIEVMAEVRRLHALSRREG